MESARRIMLLVLEGMLLMGAENSWPAAKTGPPLHSSALPAAATGTSTAAKSKPSWFASVLPLPQMGNRIFNH